MFRNWAKEVLDREPLSKDFAPSEGVAGIYGWLVPFFLLLNALKTVRDWGICLYGPPNTPTLLTPPIPQ